METKSKLKNVDEQVTSSHREERLVMPLYLWLQWHGVGDDDPEDASEVTWNREKIYDHDVEYVHADEIRRALMGHRRSELWGENGLIAATMRCVDAIGMIADLVTTDLVTTDHETKEVFIQRVRGILGHNKYMENKNTETNSGLIGKFVSAKVKNDDWVAQGLVISENPLIIRGELKDYECIGEAVIVSNPPENNIIK